MGPDPKKLLKPEGQFQCSAATQGRKKRVSLRRGLSKDEALRPDVETARRKGIKDLDKRMRSDTAVKDRFPVQVGRKFLPPRRPSMSIFLLTLSSVPRPGSKASIMADAVAGPQTPLPTPKT